MTRPSTRSPAKAAARKAARKPRRKKPRRKKPRRRGPGSRSPRAGRSRAGRSRAGRSRARRGRGSRSPRAGRGPAGRRECRSPGRRGGPGLGVRHPAHNPIPHGELARITSTCWTHPRNFVPWSLGVFTFLAKSVSPARLDEDRLERDDQAHLVRRRSLNSGRSDRRARRHGRDVTWR